VIEIIHSRGKKRLADKLRQIRERSVALDAELMSQVAAIIQDVRHRGDAAPMITPRSSTVAPLNLRISA
jgi:histidinol dehydrogenase